jgi:hypothetical protein
LFAFLFFLTCYVRCRKKIEPIINDTKALEEAIRDTGTLAENVSKKVRELDCIRERVNLAAQRVNDILDMKVV